MADISKSNLTCILTVLCKLDLDLYIISFIISSQSDKKKNRYNVLKPQVNATRPYTHLYAHLPTQPSKMIPSLKTFKQDV